MFCFRRTNAVSCCNLLMLQSTLWLQRSVQVAVLQDYRENGYASAIFTAREIPKGEWYWWKGVAKYVFFFFLFFGSSPEMKFKSTKNVFIMTFLPLLWTNVCRQLIVGFIGYLSAVKFMNSFRIQTFECSEIWKAEQVAQTISRNKMFDIEREELPPRYQEICLNSTKGIRDYEQIKRAKKTHVIFFIFIGII